MTLVGTGIIEIGRMSTGLSRVASLGIGLMHACFHWPGMVEVCIVRLIIVVSGPQNAAAPSFSQNVSEKQIRLNISALLAKTHGGSSGVRLTIEIQ